MPMGLGSFASRVVATLVVATDGTGDFTDIQTAIDALPATGGCIYIKEGTYTITAPLSITSSNIAIVGCGKSTKIVTVGNIHALDAAVVSGIHIEKIWFYGSGAGANNVGIAYITVTNSRIENCWIENFASDGIVTIAASSGVVISRCHLVENGGSGVTLAGSACVVAENVVHGNIEDGIALHLSNNSIIVNNLVTYNDADNTGGWSGIYITNSDNNIIMGNRCRNNFGAEIFIAVGSDDTIVVGNQCFGADHLLAIVDNGINTEMGHNKED